MIQIDSKNKDKTISNQINMHMPVIGTIHVYVSGNLIKPVITIVQSDGHVFTRNSHNVY